MRTRGGEDLEKTSFKYGPSGAEAEVFRESWPGAFMQMTACYTQLMIIVGLCMDGGRSLTGWQFKRGEVNTKTMLRSQIHY